MTRIITKSQLKQIILEESRRTVMDNILLETKMTLRHLCEAEGVTTGEAREHLLLSAVRMCRLLFP